MCVSLYKLNYGFAWDPIFIVTMLTTVLFYFKSKKEIEKRIYPSQPDTSAVKAFKPQHKQHSGVIWRLYRDHAQKPLQCTCSKQEQMDSHSTASKVNRVGCHLKVNCCLFNVCVCFDFTVGELLFSCLLFRGQQRSGFDKAAFISVCEAGIWRGLGSLFSAFVCLCDTLRELMLKWDVAESQCM